jgi:preprotein translocase subunit SecA
LVEQYAPRQGDLEEWDLEALEREASRLFSIDPASLDFTDKTADEIREEIWSEALKSYEAKEALVPREILQKVERDVMLQIVDAQWKDHLYSLDHLKDGIGLRGYGQRDPLVEYKKESFSLFSDMKGRVDDEIVRYLWALRPMIQEAPADGVPPPMPAVPRRPPPQAAPLLLNNPQAEASASSIFAAPVRGGGTAAAVAAPPRPPQPARVGGDDADVKTVRRDEPKVGRNDPCPCGSGKKYKKCHGAAAG